MKTVINTVNVVLPEATDSRPSTLDEILRAGHNTWEKEHGIQSALKALLHPHCTFPQTIIYRDGHNFLKVQLTINGWSHPLQITNTIEMHTACDQLCNNITPKDIITAMSTYAAQC